jgi:hypothetical protein
MGLYIISAIMGISSAATGPRWPERATSGARVDLVFVEIPTARTETMAQDRAVP